jgi:hypothetical protein
LFEADGNSSSRTPCSGSRWRSCGTSPRLRLLLATAVLPTWRRAFSVVQPEAEAALPTYSFTSGLALSGSVAYATFGIGGIKTQSPIPVMYVDAVGCTSQQPNCDAKGQSASDYSFLGTPYRAILGVGMRTGPDSIGNPMVQLPGQPAFAVVTSGYDSSTGQMMIGPGSLQSGTFSTFQLPVLSSVEPLPNGASAWDDRYGLPACLSYDITQPDDTGMNQFCVTAELDSGDPGAYIQLPELVGSGSFLIPSGAAVQIVIGPAPQPLGTLSFTVGETPAPGRDLVTMEPSNGGKGFMNIGTMLFFQYDVLFDQANGIVGLSGP